MQIRKRRACGKMHCKVRNKKNRKKCNCRQLVQEKGLSEDEFTERTCCWSTARAQVLELDPSQSLFPRFLTIFKGRGRRQKNDESEKNKKHFFETNGDDLSTSND